MKALQITQRGVALLAVLWLVAAMGLIITGIVKSVRGEIRTVALQRQAVVANARADAAILLALQNLQSQGKEPGAPIQAISVAFEDLTSRVSVIPLNGRIDLNNAPVVLLADMYRYAGGLPADAAQALAQATVELRQVKTAKGNAQGFDASEELLRVPTMTYNLYAKLTDLITADIKQGSGRVNPLAAPVGVLQILTGGDVARAVALDAGRNASPGTLDTSFLKPEHIEMASSRSVRLQVQIDLPDGGATQRAWTVYWGSDPRSGLPWRMLGTQQSLLPLAPPDNR
jgi:general secretion pathway protein K